MDKVKQTFFAVENKSGSLIILHQISTDSLRHMKYLLAITAVIFFIAHPVCKSFSFPFTEDSEQSLLRAERFFEQSKYDSALHYYNLAAKNFKTQKAWKKYITAVAGKAHTLIKLDAYDDARTILDSTLVFGNKLFGKSIEVASVYFVYGVLLDLTNKPKESLAMHQEALEIRKALLGPNHFQVSESYNGMGEVYRYILRDYVEAEKCFQKAIDILELSPQAHLKNLYRGYYNLATTNRLKNDFDRALGFAFNAVKILESIKPVDHTSFIRCYGIIANIYNDQGLYEMAIAYYRKALSLRQDRKEISSEMANDYSNLSQAYIEVGKFSKALQCIDSALQITMQGTSYDSAAIATIYMIKGNALREAKLYPDALENFRLSLAIQKNFSRANVLDVSDLYSHFSETLFKSGQYDSALDYAQRGIQYAVGNDTTLHDFANHSFERLVHNPR
jgi:tetratricopeptide (TPR) repeat protein